jgi:hemerythrin
VKVAEIDTQHKKLIDMINKLYDAMKVGKSKDVMGEI